MRAPTASEQQAQAAQRQRPGRSWGRRAAHPLSVEQERWPLKASHVWARKAIRGVARLLKKILDGAAPGELPFEQPTKLSLFINLKTAKVLGIAVPPTLLALADELIE